MEAQKELQKKVAAIDKFYNSRRRVPPEKKENTLFSPPPPVHNHQEHARRFPPNTQTNKNQKVLTAYLEPPTTLHEDVKPLPRRKTSGALLEVAAFPEVQWCSTLLRDFGKFVVDNFPSNDPYLPWIHDFFPTKDGTLMKFIGQNRRNCQTGEGMYASMRHWKPQITLFQPVPVVSRRPQPRIALRDNIVARMC